LLVVGVLVGVVVGVLVGVVVGVLVYVADIIGLTLQILIINNVLSACFINSNIFYYYYTKCF
jgi:hypothetical protein